MADDAIEIPISVPGADAAAKDIEKVGASLDTTAKKSESVTAAMKKVADETAKAAKKAKESWEGLYNDKEQEAFFKRVNAIGGASASAADRARAAEILAARNAATNNVGLFGFTKSPAQAYAELNAARAGGSGSIGGGGGPPVDAALDAVGGAGRRATESLGQFRAVASALTGVVRSLATAMVGGLVAAFTTIADQARETQERLSLFVRDGERLRDLLKGIQSTAGSTSANPADLARAQERLLRSDVRFAPPESLTTFVDTLQKTGEIGLSGPNEIASSIEAITRDLEKGTLTAQTYNKVLEQTPLIGRLIERTFGLAGQRLEEYLDQGLGKASNVLYGVNVQAELVNKAFGEQQRTLVSLGTQFVQTFQQAEARLGNTTGFTQKLADTFTYLSKNIETVVPIVNSLALALGAFLIGGPIAAGIVGAIALFVQFQDRIDKFYQKLTGNESVTIANVFAGLVEYLKDMFDWFGKLIVRAREFGTTLAESIKNGITDAANFIYESISGAFDRALKAVKKSVDDFVDSLPGAALVKDLKATYDRVNADGTALGSAAGAIVGGQRPPTLLERSGVDARDLVGAGYGTGAAQRVAEKSFVQSVAEGVKEGLIAVATRGAEARGASATAAAAAGGAANDNVDPTANLRALLAELQAGFGDYGRKAAEATKSGSDSIVAKIEVDGNLMRQIAESGNEINKAGYDFLGRKLEGVGTSIGSLGGTTASGARSLDGGVFSTKGDFGGTGGTFTITLPGPYDFSPAAAARASITGLKTPTRGVYEAAAAQISSEIQGRQQAAIVAELRQQLGLPADELSFAASELKGAAANLNEAVNPMISAYGAGDYYTRSAAPTGVGGMRSGVASAGGVVINFTVNTQSLDSRGFGQSASQIQAELAAQVVNALRRA